MVVWTDGLFGMSFIRNLFSNQLKPSEDRVMLFMMVLAGSFLVAALFAQPKSILSSSMIFPGTQQVPDSRLASSPLANVLDGVIKGKAGFYSSVSLRDPEVVAQIYAARGYVPLWHSGEKLTPGARFLLATFDAAEAQGLDHDNYQVSTRLQGANAKLVLELLITDALLAYIRDLGTGCLDPGDVYWKWEPSAEHHSRSSITHDLIVLLRGSPWPGGVISVEKIAQMLLGFQPSYRQYDRLKDSLLKYQIIVEKGGWPSVTSGPNLSLGDSGLRVGLLRHRLQISGDILGTDVQQKDYFDKDLQTAVYRFQQRCGLPQSGIVDGKTLAVLNVTASERARCITWNMERLRWLPHDLGKRHVRVNIPSYELQMCDAAGVVGSMAVAVGRPKRPTPIMSKELTSMVLNPYWNVPVKLARYDLLPAVRRDSTYLSDRSIRVFSGWNYDDQEIDTRQVCWTDIEPADLAYRFRQDPGPRNALGRVKFLFSNKYAVYLHDTNNRAVFQRSNRAISSGCVRLEKPDELADFLMVPRNTWNQVSYSEVKSSGKTTSVDLELPVRIHIIYLTAFVDVDGVVNFRPDIYEYDKKMANLMK